MSVWDMRRLIKCHVSSCKDFGKLLKGLRAAWPVILVHDIGVVPLIELQNLHQIRRETRAPLLRGRKHRLSRDICDETAELKHLDAARILKGNSSLHVFINRRNR